METTTQLTAPENKPLTTKNLFDRDDVKRKFEALLGKKAVGFITSVLQSTTANKLLAKADPYSIYHSAAIAATLDLPINPNLGFAWLVPYGNQCQFQIGWRGLVQLAMRTGQYLRMNVIPVYENQFKSYNTLTEDLGADFSIEGSGNVKGYCAYFKLLNGFEKTVYWSVEKVSNHGKRYSKSFGNGPWKTHFDEMAQKTVLKNTISKWGILSIEMQTAMKVDQAIIKDSDTVDVDYVDAPDLQITQADEVDKLKERVELMLKDCNTIEDVQEIALINPELDSKLIDARIEEIEAEEKKTKGGKNGK